MELLRYWAAAKRTLKSAWAIPTYILAVLGGWDVVAEHFLAADNQIAEYRVQLPSCVWIVLALMGLVVAAVHEAVKADRSLEALREGKDAQRDAALANIRLKSAIEYLQTELPRGPEDFWEDVELTFRCADAIEEAAVDGQITVWGRPRFSGSYESLPNTYWITAQIQRHVLMNHSTDEVGTEGKRVGVEIVPYDGLMLNEAQVRSTWRRRII